MLKDIIFCSALVILLVEVLRLNQSRKKLNKAITEWVNYSKTAAEDHWKKQNDAIHQLIEDNTALVKLLKAQEQQIDHLRAEYKQSSRKTAIDIRALHLRTDGVLHQLHERTKCLQPHNDQPQPN